jgi:superfamily II DNA or RNA helicase
MRIVRFDIFKGNKAIIQTDLLPTIREKMSVANKNAVHVERVTGRSVTRIYSITPTGRFDIGLFKDIKNVIKGLGAPVKYEYSDAFLDTCLPQFPDFEADLPDLGLVPYDYQTHSVKRMLKFGRGCILVGTGGGKTFIMSLLTKAVMNNEPNKRFLVIVPTLQLVEQTHQDFLDYGYDPSMISKWSGKNPFQNTQIIVASASILQSKSSDLKFLSKIDVLMVDEVHILKKSNSINKIIDKIPAVNRFGFTGTMPEEPEDVWNVIGKIGPILFEKDSKELRDGKFITEAKIDVIKVDYNMDSLTELHNRLDQHERKYQSELEFVMEHEYRNTLVTNLAKVSRGNTLVMVDRIAHGEILTEMLKKACSAKQIYFIQGSVGVDDREVVREIMEGDTNVICVAISKIFSTGINIKNIHNIIFATPGKAKVKLIQSIGRGLRLHESKTLLRVFDFADNLHYSNKHLMARVKLYISEKLNYEIRTIKEPT